MYPYFIYPFCTIVFHSVDYRIQLIYELVGECLGCYQFGAFIYKQYCCEHLYISICKFLCGHTFSLLLCRCPGIKLSCGKSSVVVTSNVSSTPFCLLLWCSHYMYGIALVLIFTRLFFFAFPFCGFLLTYRQVGRICPQPCPDYK